MKEETKKAIATTVKMTPPPRWLRVFKRRSIYRKQMKKLIGKWINLKNRLPAKTEDQNVIEAKIYIKDQIEHVRLIKTGEPSMDKKTLAESINLAEDRYNSFVEDIRTAKVKKNKEGKSVIK